MVAYFHNTVVLQSTVHRHFTVASTLIFTVPKFLIIIIIIITNYTHFLCQFLFSLAHFIDRHAHTVWWFVK